MSDMSDMSDTDGERGRRGALPHNSWLNPLPPTIMSNDQDPFPPPPTDSSHDPGPCPHTEQPVKRRKVQPSPQAVIDQFWTDFQRRNPGKGDLSTSQVNRRTSS